MKNDPVHDPALEMALQKRDKSAPRPLGTLLYALSRNRLSQAGLLLKYGWNANDTLEDEVPHLAQALLRGETRDCIRYLLEYHADPSRIPADLWQLNESSFYTKVGVVDPKKTAWCQKQHRAQLARVFDIDFDLKCQFHRALEVQELYNEPELKLLLDAPSVAHFPYKNIWQIGSGKTCDKVMGYLQSYLLMPFMSKKKQRPLVLLFIGPPGQRKSQLADDLAGENEVLPLESLRCDNLPKDGRKKQPNGSDKSVSFYQRDLDQHSEPADTAALLDEAFHSKCSMPLSLTYCLFCWSCHKARGTNDFTHQRTETCLGV